MQLYELFNANIPMKFKETDGDVDMKGQLPDGSYIEVQFGKNPHGESYEITFARGGREDMADASFDKTQMGSEKVVFGVVINAIHQFIQKYHPTELTFTASKKPSVPDNRKMSRTNLYSAIVSRVQIPGFRSVKKPYDGFDEYRFVKIGGPEDNNYENDPNAID